MTRVKLKKQTNVTNMITFELLAPRNEDVKLVGSWNNWQPIPMERQDNGTWCVDVELVDGDYEYQFQVVSKSKHLGGEVITVADPTALQYSPDSDTSYNTLLKIRDGKRLLTSYQWQHDDVPLPTNEQLIIYELHLADFRGGRGDSDEAEGTFQRLIDKLDYLVDLGINAIQLIPINETAEDDYWGYSQRSIYAVENTYGSPDDFCRLVDECHGRGIRVIHDAVFNHVNEQSPLAQIDYGYWFYEENPDEPDLQLVLNLTTSFMMTNSTSGQHANMLSMRSTCGSSCFTLMACVWIVPALLSIMRCSSGSMTKCTIMPRKNHSTL